jgi:hypothetical protein
MLPSLACGNVEQWIEDFVLSPLTREDVLQLVAETLHTHRSSAEHLATLVHLKDRRQPVVYDSIHHHAGARGAAHGIRLPTSCRAYTRGPDRPPILDMLLVSVDLSDVRFA